jgi:hypothetical protein
MHGRFPWLLWLALAALGCGKSDSPVSEQPGELKRREISSLPAVNEYLPPLDGGELSVAPPADWHVLPRGRTFLLALAPGKADELPRITINAEFPPDGSPVELTEENAAAFARQQDEALERAAKTGKKKVHEFHLPIVLGDNVFIRHVRQASVGKGVPCAIQSLETIHAGRMYTLDLIVAIDPKNVEDYGEALTKYRDYAYAVAAHFKFASPSISVQPKDSGETNPAVPAKETNPETNPEANPAPPAKKSD